MKNRPPRLSKISEHSKLIDKLGRPKAAWENYLRQKNTGSRYSLDRLIQSAEDMESGGDYKARYCAGMAYAEAGMRLAESIYMDEYQLQSSSRNYNEKAGLLLSSALNQAERLKDYLDINLRTKCLDLYKIPIWSRIYEIESVQDTQRIVSEKIDDEILAINTILRNDDLTGEQKAWLTGAVNEYTVLRALQSPKLLENGLLAIPSFPWEEDGLDNATLHTKGVRRTNNTTLNKKNTNYDISIINLSNPLDIIKKIQVKTNHKYHQQYSDDITTITTNPLARELAAEEENPLSTDLALNLFAYPNDDNERKRRMSKITDCLIEKLSIPVSSLNN